MKPPAPPRVDDHYRFWGDPPPERSPRCAWWVARIEGGWRPNRRITCEGYDASSSYYGVYIWEYLHVISPLLGKLREKAS